MNHCLIELFSKPERIDFFTRHIPEAFSEVRSELGKGNPAVGILRENVIIGFFLAEFGVTKVDLVEEGNKRGHDVVICGEELSIKTITQDGGVKILWTVDNDSVDKEIEGGYQPHCDMMLISIYWGEIRDSVFYIPVHVQKEAHLSLKKDYFNVDKHSNHRGIEISSVAMGKLKNHRDTKRAMVDWTFHKDSLKRSVRSYERWTEFWGLRS